MRWDYYTTQYHEPIISEALSWCEVVKLYFVAKGLHIFCWWRRSLDTGVTVIRNYILIKVCSKVIQGKCLVQRYNLYGLDFQVFLIILPLCVVGMACALVKCAHAKGLPHRWAAEVGYGYQPPLVFSISTCMISDARSRHESISPKTAFLALP